MRVHVTKDRWFRRFGPENPVAPTLVCFPHAGGTAGSYSDLAAEIVPALNVVAVQYPGHLERFDEPVIEDIGVVARHVASRLADTVNSPLLLFGHSMGALVAFASARELAIAGVSVTALFLSACAPPQDEPDEPLWSEATSEALASHLAGLGGIPSAFLRDTDFVDMLVSILRSDYRAIEQYTIPQGFKLHAPIAALYGWLDPTVTRSRMTRWGRFSHQDLKVAGYPCGHFYTKESLPQVAEVIRGSAV